MRKPFRTQNAAVTAAFFIAPVLPSILLLLAGPSIFPADWRGMAVVYLFAIPLIFVLGLPLFLLFSRFRLFSWWGSILGGALGGVAILTLLGGRHNLHGYALLLYGVVGAATGLAFWTVVMLGPEPNQFTARNWVEPFRRRRE
jgi:hypothetical protein